MSSAPGVAFVEDSILADDGTDYKLRVSGPWLSMYGGSHLDTGLRLAALEANLGAKVGWRTASVLTSAPDGWETLGTARTADGKFPEAFSLTGKTGLWVQAALFSALPVGTTPKTAFAQLWSTVRGTGWLIARARLLLRPTGGSSNDVVLPIGAPFPCADVTGLMFGMSFTGVSGSISPTTVYRTFDTGDPLYPNAWTSVTAESAVTTDSRVNSNNTVTTSGKIMAQAGLSYSTSGTDPYGVVDVVVAAKQG